MKQVIKFHIIIVWFLLQIAAPIKGQSPGGVATPLQAWYKADEGVTGSPVTLMEDHSANNYDLDASAGPDLLQNEINFHPALSFDGSTQYLKIDDGILRSGTFNDFTVFVVNKTDVLEQRVIFEQAVTGGKIGANIPWNNNQAIFNMGLGGSAGKLGVTWSSVNGEPAIWAHCSSTGTSTPTGTNKSTHLNGLEMGTNTKISGMTGMSTTFYLGTKNASQKFYKGTISEFILFTGNMTALELQQTTSYLALKYGITQSNNTDSDGSLYESPNQDGNHEGDYLNSSGTAVWDASVNQGYHNDVAGIGLDIMSGLNQKQSKSSNGDIVAIGLGEVASTHAGNSNTFPVDNSYLIWGNNSGGLTESSSDLPSGIPFRLQREWYVQETGSIGNVALEFDISGLGLSGSHKSEFKLLVDTDGDGDFTDGGATSIDAASYANDIATFTNVDLISGEVFTLAIVPNLPPYFSSTPPTTANYNQEYTYNIVAVDPESVELTLSVDTIPDWLSYTDNGDGTASLSGTPTCSDKGDYIVALRARDDIRDSTHTYTLTVEGSDTDLPVIVGEEDLCTSSIESYSVTDPGDHTFQWTVINGSIVGLATNPEVFISWAGTGSGSVSVEVESSSGCMESQSINITRNLTPLTGNKQSNDSLNRR